MENTTNKIKENEELLKEVEEKAKKNLRGIIRENQVGYKGYLIKEMKSIFKEMQIEWEPDNDSISID